MLSFFLAKLLGLYLLIVISAVFINRKNLERIVKDFSSNLALVYVSGFFNLLVGLLVVLSHNIWTNDWRVLITIIGWITFFKGVIRLFAPEKVTSLANKFNKTYFLNIICVIFFLIGLYLTYKGFV